MKAPIRGRTFYRGCVFFLLVPSWKIFRFAISGLAHLINLRIGDLKINHKNFDAWEILRICDSGMSARICDFRKKKKKLAFILLLTVLYILVNTATFLHLKSIFSLTNSLSIQQYHEEFPRASPTHPMERKYSLPPSLGPPTPAFPSPPPPQSSTPVLLSYQPWLQSIPMPFV